jgi:GR25 family glycosyltransferase involved in LPS biosynthesis
MGGGEGSIRSAKHLALENFRKSKPPVSEAYVISLHESKFNVFEQRNFDIAGGVNGDDDDVKGSSSSSNEQGCGSTSLEFFQAYDGMNQTVLDEYSRITGLKRLNVSTFEGKDPKTYKGQNTSPHTVGCFLSHWRLLEKVQSDWKTKKNSEATTTAKPKKQGKPDMLFVFEDDAYCVSNLIDRVWTVVQKLPKDWDILYIGGKPFSVHTMNQTLQELLANTVQEDKPRPSDKELKERMCRGDFGTSATGPFPPGITKEDSYQATIGANLAEDPPYWESKLIYNTNSYVINPRRLQRVLRVLSQRQRIYKPIDVKLANDFDREFREPRHMSEGSNAPLKAFLTPRTYCDQEANRVIGNRDQPPSWEGYHWLPWRKHKGYPDSQAFVWGKTASLETCSGVNIQATKKK